MATKRAKKGAPKVVRARVTGGPGRVVASAPAFDLGGAFDMIKYAKFLPILLSVVSAIQVLRGPGDGPAKKAAAMAIVAASLALYEGISEKDVLNDAEFLALVGELIELGVTLMKLKPRVDEIAKRIRSLKPAA